MLLVVQVYNAGYRLQNSCSQFHYALKVAMRVCNRVSKRLELIGISGVWNGFFMTASESDISLCLCTTPAYLQIS